MCAPFVIEGGVTSAVFETYSERVLRPELHSGDILILDNLAVHKSLTVQRVLHAQGVTLSFIPIYSPDFSPIENAFAKLKAFLRKVHAQTLACYLTVLHVPSIPFQPMTLLSSSLTLAWYLDL